MTKRQWQSLVGFIVTMLVTLFVAQHPSADTRSTSKEPISPSADASPPAISQEKSPENPLAVSLAHGTTAKTNATVLRALDGDTIEALLDGEEKPMKVRFIGVNTAESVDPRRPVECFGKEASAFTKNLLEGKRVLLKEDLQADERDKYGRLLRNIFLEDGTDVNAMLIREGYAYAYVSFPQDRRRKAELKRLQEEAKNAKRGLWNPETCDGIK